MAAEHPLVDLAAIVADGGTPDWAELEASADPRQRSVIGRLRTLSEIARIHQTLTTAGLGASPAVRTLLEPFATWGDLQILEVIGSGRFGDVYRAFDLSLDREVALKILAPQAGDEDEPTAVVEEGRLGAKVRHPNVVTIFGARRIDGRMGVWMELVRGRTLEAELAVNGRFGADALTRVAVELGGALAAVHEAGFVHRDVKTTNAMRDADGRVVLGDFGTGRQHDADDETRSGLAGTPSCLAPEIFDGKPATPRSDIYSLGVLLFRLATGQFPVTARSLQGYRAAHQTGTPASLATLRPDLPRQLTAAVDRALSPDPDNRFKTATELVRAIDPPAASSVRSLITWRMAMAAVLALVAVGSLVVGALTGLLSPSAPTGLTVVHLTPELQAKFAFRGPAFNGQIPCSPRGRPAGPSVALCNLLDGSVRMLRESAQAKTGPPPTPGESSMAGTVLLSPDGRRLAYIWVVESDPPTTTLRVMNVNGEDDRPLHALTRGAITIRGWTADGRGVFLEDRAAGTGRDVVASLDGPPVVLRTRLPEDEGGDLSPDRRTIVVSRRAGSTSDIVALDAATGAERWRVADPASDFFPKFTPDGDGLVFVSDRLGGHSVFQVNLSANGPSGPPALLREFGRGRVEPIAFGAGGSLFMRVQPGARTAYVADLDLDSAALGTPSPIDPRAVEDTMAASWSPGDAEVAYLRGRAIQSVGTVPAQVVVRRADGTTTWEFTLAGALMNYGNRVEWSPDGRRFAVLYLQPGGRAASGTPTANLPALDVIDIASRTADRVRTGSMFDPKWDKSGRALYLGTSAAIVRMSDQGAEVSPVYSAGDSERLKNFDLWPGTGALAVLVESTRGAGGPVIACQLRIIREGQTTAEIPLASRECTSVVWADESRVLVGVLPRSGPLLFLVDTKTRQSTRLPMAMEGVRDLRPSRNGRKLLFTAGDPRPDIYEMSGLLTGRKSSPPKVR